MVKLDMINQLCCLHEIFVLSSHKLFASTQKSIMIFHRGKMKVANTMFQAINNLWYNQKLRSTFFQGRENDASIMMIVTYGMVFCTTKIMTKQMTYSYTMHILFPLYAIVFQVMKSLE
jgi:urease accessory protein UreF